MATTDIHPVRLGGMLSQLTLRTRLYAGFLILIAIATLLGSVGLWGITQLGGYISIMALQGDQVQRVLIANTALETTRRGLVRFMFDGAEAAVKDMQAAQVRAKDLLTEVVEKSDLPQYKALYSNVLARVNEQIPISLKVVELGRTAIDARDRLAKTANEFSVATDKVLDLALASHDETLELAAAAAERAVLLTRISTLEFLATRNPAGIEKFRAAADQTIVALDALEQVASAEVGQLIGPIRGSLVAYRKDFEIASAALLTQRGLFVDKTVPLVVGMQNDLAKATDGTVTNFSQQVDAGLTTITSVSLIELIVGGVGLVIGLALAFVIARSIVRPLAGMTGAMDRLANGDLAVDIPARDSGDEIGDMARAVEVFKLNGIEAARLTEAQQAERVAKEQRTRKIEGLISGFESQVTGALQALASSATKLNTTATSMAGTAEETTCQVIAVAAASEQATNNVQTVAVATEELSASVNEIGRQMEQSTRMAGQAVVEAEATTAAVLGLANMAREVDNVVKIISEIAGQTNLLALNATIEAARAGEAGKGFAVVASEVKALANRTAKATDEISGQINEMQSATATSVERIQAIGKTITEMNGIAAAIASSVEQQGLATREIARSVQEAAKGTGEVSSNINGVRQAASETGAAASEVQTTSGEVAQQGATLKLEVDRFLNGIRAA